MKIATIFLFLLVWCNVSLAQTNVIKNTTIPKSDRFIHNTIEKNVKRDMEINKLDNEINYYRNNGNNNKAFDLENKKMEIKTK